MGLTAVEILVVDERGHVAALMHDAQDDGRAIRRIKPLVEEVMSQIFVQVERA